MWDDATREQRGSRMRSYSTGRLGCTRRVMVKEEIKFILTTVSSSSDSYAIRRKGGIKEMMKGDDQGGK
jgi:hypothetical protein